MHAPAVARWRSYIAIMHRRTQPGGPMTRFLAILTAVVGLSMAAVDAEAASRMGGGRSIGKQRDMTQQAQPKAPAQQQQAPATPQQQPSGMSRWLGPLAGLALGAGLAALF